MPSSVILVSISQLCSVPHRIWVDITLTHMHHLTTDCAILTWRRGVRGTDEQDQIGRSIQPPPRRFRQAFSDERSVLLGLYKKKGRVQDPLSDSEVEVVEEPSTVKRRRIDDPAVRPVPLSGPLSSLSPKFVSNLLSHQHTALCRVTTSTLGVTASLAC